jgi:hypothetical protein
MIPPGLAAAVRRPHDSPTPADLVEQLKTPPNRSALPADDLAAWIDELRRRLDAGEVAAPPPIDLGNEVTLTNVEPAVRRMLSDVEMFRAMDPAERELPHFAARRRALADNLCRLRERLPDRSEQG